MKRSFTFTMSRKVSTAPYENADVFVAEGIEMDEDTEKRGPSAWGEEKTILVSRVRKLVDGLADGLRGKS